MISRRLFLSISGGIAGLGLVKSFPLSSSPVAAKSNLFKPVTRNALQQKANEIAEMRRINVDRAKRRSWKIGASYRYQ